MKLELLSVTANTYDGGHIVALKATFYDGLNATPEWGSFDVKFQPDELKGLTLEQIEVAAIKRIQARL